MSITNILLKEFSQRGVLYHFTTYRKAVLIGKSNKLKRTLKEDSISLTRNYALDDFGFVRFAIDGDKLSENYSIKPFLFQGKGYAGYKDNPDKMRQHYSKEAEERITGKDIYPLDRYLIQIDLFDFGKRNIELLKREIQDQFKNIPVDIVKEWEPVKPQTMSA